MYYLNDLFKGKKGMSITIDNKDAWKGIVVEIAHKDWEFLCTNLTLVSRGARGAALEHVEKCVLPIMERICSPDSTISILQRYYKYKGELEKKVFIRERYWHRPIHLCLKNLLSSVLTDDYQVERTKWQLLQLARVNVVATSSRGETVLLLVCNSLSSLFSKRLMGETLKTAHARLVQLLEELLLKGADPNHQGDPSTALITILSQQPYSCEDTQLMYEMVKLLLAHKADPYLIPTKDLYGFRKSPFQLAAKNSFIYSLFKKA